MALKRIWSVHPILERWCGLGKKKGLASMYRCVYNRLLQYTFSNIHHFENPDSFAHLTRKIETATGT